MYNGIYKCRLCGESYIRCSTNDSNKVVKHFIGMTVPEQRQLQQVEMIDMHGCKDGSYGLSDFQGFMKD